MEGDLNNGQGVLRAASLLLCVHTLEHLKFCIFYSVYHEDQKQRGVDDKREYTTTQRIEDNEERAMTPQGKGTPISRAELGSDSVYRMS